MTNEPYERVFITTHGVEVPLGDYPADVAHLIELEIRWQIETCITEHVSHVRRQPLHTTRQERIASASAKPVDVVVNLCTPHKRK